jgi:hypothetical protein
MKAAFVLEHCNDPLIVWPQLQINAHEIRPICDPMYHPFLILGHQGEEAVYLVTDHIWSFMTIYIDTFLQLYALPSQLNELSPGRAFR